MTSAMANAREAWVGLTLAYIMIRVISVRDMHRKERLIYER